MINANANICDIFCKRDSSEEEKDTIYSQFSIDM